MTHRRNRSVRKRRTMRGGTMWQPCEGGGRKRTNRRTNRRVMRGGDSCTSPSCDHIFM